jgi:putative addiction module component (TIGR02574 family)
MSFDELRAAVLALPADERQKLYEDLSDSIDRGDVVSVPPELVAEWDRRYKELQDDPKLGVSGNEVIRRLEAKYGG